MSKVIKHSPPPPPRNLFPFLPISRHDGERKTSGYDFSQFDSCPSFSFFTLARDIARFSFCERCNSITVRSFYFSTTRERTIYNLVKISPLSSFWSMLQESRFGWGGGKKKRYFEIFGSKYVRYISRLIIDLLFFVSLYKSLWYEIYIVKIN